MTPVSPSHLLCFVEPEPQARSWHRRVAVVAVLAGFLAIALAAPQPAAAKGDQCYAFPHAKLTHQVRNVEFKVTHFSWFAGATADQSDSYGDTSHAETGNGNGNGIALVGYHHGGYIESQSGPTNAGGYTHLPNACQFHSGAGTDNGAFDVSAHVPFTLTGSWSVPPDSGTCNDSDALFNPSVQGGFSRYGSTVKITIKYNAFPIGDLSGGDPSGWFPKDNTQCNPPDPLGDFPGLGSHTLSVPESKLLHEKDISLFIDFQGPLVSMSSDYTRTGQASVGGHLVLQRVGPLRCARQVKCGAARFEP